MALIKCPECGKEVSNMAKACIHCGFPFDTLNDNKLYRLIITGFVSDVPSEKAKQISESVMLMRDMLDILQSKGFGIVKNLPSVLIDGLTKENADYIIKEFNKTGCILTCEESDTTNRNRINDIIYNKANNIEIPLMCPRCHSTHVNIGKRGFSIITGFIGANKTVNRCGKCGFTWKP